MTPRRFQDGYALEFRATTYRLPSGAALISGLNLSIARGETLVLLGRSGSGKTTTLKLINRLLEPTEGEILIAGRPSGSWDPIQLRRGIGYVIQDAGLIPALDRGAECRPCAPAGTWPEEKIQARVREMLRWLACRRRSSPNAARPSFPAARSSAWG